MNHFFSVTLIAITLVTTNAHAQTPVADLAKPPAGAQHFIISSTGGKHGDSWMWHTSENAPAKVIRRKQ